MQRIVQINGDWWPASDTECRPAVMSQYKDADIAIKRCRKKEVVIQAGGNCGIWARYLSEIFETVYTFEPDADNFQCLVLNAPAKNIYKMQAALGAICGVTSLARTPDNVGAHRIGGMKIGSRNEIPMMAIDKLKLPACDFIQFDLEGYEHFALIGAEKTILKFRPVLMLEDKGHEKKYGIPEGALHEMLKNWNYKLFKKVHRDIIMIPAEL